MVKKVEEEAIKHRIWRFLCIFAGINSYNSDMIHNIFYSWQSDLPEENNKAYIGSCLHKALSKIKEDKNFSLEYVIDRATSKRIGTIDIAQTIFNKINTAKLFVADVSIINHQSRKNRKTPNPNVLIELGYAVRTIGWENVICIFNTKYGNPEDLPFDIRNRRLLLYNSKDDKSILINDLCHIIKGSDKMRVPSDIIRDFYNAKIYTSLFQLISDVHKMLFGYEDGTTIKNINKTLNLQQKDVFKKLSNCTLLGFQLFKSYQSIITELRSQLEKILTIRQFNDIYYVPLVEIIDTLKLHDKALNRWIETDELRQVSDNNRFSLLSNASCSKDLPYRFVLLQKLEGERDYGRIVDFGDIIKKKHQEALLHSFKLTEKTLNFYSGFTCELLKSINKWIDNNGGEFILDETELEYNPAVLKQC